MSCVLIGLGWCSGQMTVLCSDWFRMMMTVLYSDWFRVMFTVLCSDWFRVMFWADWRFSDIYKSNMDGHNVSRILTGSSKCTWVIIETPKKLRAN